MKAAGHGRSRTHFVLGLVVAAVPFHTIHAGAISGVRFSGPFPLRRRDGFSEAYFCVLFPLSYQLSASSRISIGHSMTLVWHLENGLSTSTNLAMAALRYGLTLAISRKRRAYLRGLLTPTGVSSPTCGSPRYFHLGQDDVNSGKTPKGDHAN